MSQIILTEQFSSQVPSNLYGYNKKEKITSKILLILYWLYYANHLNFSLYRYEEGIKTPALESLCYEGNVDPGSHSVLIKSMK